MKILVAAVSYSSEISGIQRHAFNLVRCLLTREEISEVHLAIAPWQQKITRSHDISESSRLHTHVCQVGRSSFNRNVWYYRSLPFLATQLKADLVHLTYPVPCGRSKFHCPVVVTLHDLYPYEIPENFGFTRVVINRLILKQCLRNADVIACVSEITSVRLTQYISGEIRKKTVYIPNSVETESHNLHEHSPHPLGEVPFLLCVAQHRRNKNILLLIRAFDRLLQLGRIPSDMKLLVVGIPGPETQRIKNLIRERRLKTEVLLLEGLSEAELQWCYKHCEALITPSLTEGFGLPVAEGLLAGCRIVCSDIPAFREIGNGHCHFVALDENSEKDLSAAIETVLGEPARLPISLPLLSAEVLAEKYLSLYTELLASSESTPSPTAIRAAAQERHS